MNRLKKGLAWLCALLMLSACAVSCAEKTDSESTDSTAAVNSDRGPESETAKEGYDKDGYILDKLPADLKFGNKTVTVLYWDDVENPEFFVDSETGNIVNDSIFSRNISVEERLGIKYSFEGCNGNWGNYQTFVNRVQNSINGGDSYDILATYSLTGGVLTYNGMVRDISGLNYIDFSAPWWSEQLLETGTVFDKLYYVSGDISTNLLYMMYAMYYNKNMVEDLKLTDPFELVSSGDWTFDKMSSMSKGVYSDLNGNNTVDADDRFGQAIYALHMDAFLYGMGCVTVDTDTDGQLKLSEDFLGDKMATVTDLVYNYSHSNDAPIIGGYKDIFKNGRGLFITDRADIAVFDLDGHEFQLGILPIPKYDKDQEDYYTVIGNPFTLYMIPVNAPDANMSAAILECQASESYRKVTPAVFELSMKTRYADGGNDVVSYDILRAGIVYDPGRIFGRVFDQAGTSPGSCYSNQVKDNGTSWSTVVKVNSKVINSVLKKLNQALSE